MDIIIRLIKIKIKTKKINRFFFLYKYVNMQNKLIDKKFKLKAFLNFFLIQNMLIF